MAVKLLVSVRNVAEAQDALRGGADIIDIKEPDNGSLGAASPAVIEDVARFVDAHRSATTVSAAMGEMTDGLDQPDNFALMSPAPSLYKAGLAGVLNNADSWQDSWAAFRRQRANLATNSQWVSVCYADYERANAPAPTTVLAEGSAFGSPVLLIDTFEKDSTDLLTWLSPAELQDLRDQTEKVGMQLAFAGRLTASRLPEILELRPDIVAVRGAACESGNRGSHVSSRCVRELKVQLDRRQHT